MNKKGNDAKRRSKGARPGSADTPASAKTTRPRAGSSARNTQSPANVTKSPTNVSPAAPAQPPGSEVSWRWATGDRWRIEMLGGLRAQCIRPLPSHDAATTGSGNSGAADADTSITETSITDTSVAGISTVPATRLDLDTSFARGPVITQFRTQKTAALLAYLAFHQQRPHSREVLSELLWPETDPEVARNSLRVALSSLRAQLEPEGVPRGSVLKANRTVVELNPAAITSDVAEFEACLNAAQKAGTSNARIQLLSEAVALYRGRLLPGIYENWIFNEEQRLSAAFYQAIYELIAHLEQAGDTDRAIHYAQRAVSVDPVREESHRELMRLYAAAGQPANVLRQYRELERILKDELGEEPSAATRDLAQDVEHRLSRRRPVSATGQVEHGEAGSGIITLMFTDIQGSTALWEKVGNEFRNELNKHNRIIRRLIQRWGGQEIKSQGDSFMISFERGTAAIQCALEIQRSLAQQNWLPEVEELLVRIGIHTGEPFHGYAPSGQTDYFGPMVNRAARIADAGHGGQILISSATHDVVHGILAADAQIADLGHHLLRGLEEPQHLYEVQYNISGSTSQDTAKGTGTKEVRRFPPLRTLDALRTNLPTFPSAFIGREQELQELEELLRQRDTRLITITGFGGMGKTRTALQLAELNAFKFADGTWWAELEEARNGDAMVQRIAYHIGLKLDARHSVREQLQDHLRQRQVLLVLDNVEQIPDAAEVIKDLLGAAPHVKCIVTSRHALDLRIEQRRELSPLPSSDAVQLFVERAGARSHFVLTDENAADVADLCHRLEGVPLAIELAASRTVGLSPREVLHRLTNRFRVLQSTSPDLPSRQRVLRTAIDWSFDLLSPAEKALFAQLAVFAGGFTMEEAEEVCADADVFEGVLELQRRSLLRTETDDVTQQTRYSMLELLRDYAAERLRESPQIELRVRARHAEYFLQHGQERVLRLRTPDEAAALHQLEITYDNLRAATGWTISAQRHAWTAELALVLGTFLERRGFHREAMSRIRQGLEAARTVDLKSVTARLLQAQARLYLDQFDWPESQHCAERALLLFEESGDERARATTTNLIGLACKGEGAAARKQGDVALAEAKFAEARCYYNKALHEFTQLDDKTGIAIVRHNLGSIEYLRAEAGDPQAAQEHWQEALRLHHEMGDTRGIAETLTNLGVLAQAHSDWEEANRLYQQALRIEQELHHVFGVGRSLSNLGEVARLQNDLPSAHRLLTAAIQLFKQVETPYLKDTLAMLEETESLLGKENLTNEADILASLDQYSMDELIAWSQGEPPAI